MSFDLGGNNGRYFSFGARGAVPPPQGVWVSGHVTDMKEVQSTDFKTKQPEFWDNGDPKMQYRVTLQTDLRDPQDQADTGLRDIYLDGRRRPNDDGTKSKLCAVLDAVREATGGTALESGAWLALGWVSGQGETGDPRCFAAQYQRAQMDVGAQQAPQPPAPPQQPPATAPPAQVPQAAAQPPTQPPAPPQAPPAQQVQTEQGPVNPATGEIQGQSQQPTGPTPEAVAAVRAAGLDPAIVFAGQQLPAGV